jgi:thiol-disulfide isomerase/thioredoxin
MRPELGMVEPPFPDEPGPGRQLNLRPLIMLVLVVGLGLAGWKFLGSGGGWLEDVDAGLVAAERSGRPVLVYFGADWCPPCVQLKKHVLSDPSIEAGLSERFELVKVDLTNRAGPNTSVAADFGIRVIPTIVLLDADGYELERVTGQPLQAWITRKSGS